MYRMKKYYDNKLYIVQFITIVFILLHQRRSVARAQCLLSSGVAIGQATRQYVELRHGTHFGASGWLSQWANQEVRLFVSLLRLPLVRRLRLVSGSYLVYHLNTALTIFFHTSEAATAGSAVAVRQLARSSLVGSWRKAIPQRRSEDNVQTCYLFSKPT